MRIGFDCATLVKGADENMEIYNASKSMLELLSKNLPKQHRLVVIGNESNRHDFAPEGVEFVSVRLRTDSRSAVFLWESFGVNSYTKRLKLDRIVFPGGMASLFCPIENIIILHDLLPVFYSKYSVSVINKMQNISRRSRLKRSIKSADKIIVVSEYLMQQVIKLVPKAEGKVCVILNGVDGAKMETLSKPDVTGNYFLAITSLKKPHKNPAAVIKAYADYCGCTDKPYKLVVAGIGNLAKLKQELPEAVLKNICCKGIVSDEEYYSLLKFSKGLIYLSLAEGFGLPVLEAMTAAVPVICSDRAALSEVVNGAGILVNPENYAEVADAMLLLTEEPDIAREYVAMGVDNLDRFYWEDRKDRYIEVLTGK